jgi:hypothetical protein
MKASRLLILAATAVLVTGAPALAFHDGGVGACNGCHTMHNSQNGQPMNKDTAGTGPGTAVGFGYPNLLLYGNKSDVCIRCHLGEGSYHIWSASPSAPSAINANRGGGDFVFLQEDNINDGRNGNQTANFIPGYKSGHSVISGIKGTVADLVNTTAPGGTYAARDMACTSCHDPHGTAAYRLLYQAGQNSGTARYTATLVADPAPLSNFETVDLHNAYKSGYSEWCGTCHGAFHKNSGNLIHPSGENLTEDVATAYNLYKGTADCIASAVSPCGTGSAVDAYIPQVPFEDETNTTTSKVGPTASSKVACVSCHRAHATSAPDAGRWDFNLLNISTDGAVSGSYAIPQPYGAGQRSLCNKCHSKDEFDEPLT